MSAFRSGVAWPSLVIALAIQSCARPLDLTAAEEADRLESTRFTAASLKRPAEEKLVRQTLSDPEQVHALVRFIASLNHDWSFPLFGELPEGPCRFSFFQQGRPALGLQVGTSWMIGSRGAGAWRQTRKLLGQEVRELERLAGLPPNACDLDAIISGPQTR